MSKRLSSNNPEILNQEYFIAKMYKWFHSCCLEPPQRFREANTPAAAHKLVSCSVTHAKIFRDFATRVHQPLIISWCRVAVALQFLRQF